MKNKLFQEPKPADMGFFKDVPYDQRSGRGVPAGSDYGVGKKNPVGSLKTSSKSPIPGKNEKA